MFVDEQHIVLEAGVQVWLEAEVHNDGVVVAVDVSVDTVQSLEDLAEKTGESLRKWNAYGDRHVSSCNVEKKILPGTHRFGLETSVRYRYCSAPRS